MARSRSTNGPTHSPAGGEGVVLSSGTLTGRSDAFGFAWEEIVDLAAGTDLGGVTILRLLAEGGMGRVYLGRQQLPDRLVAVKVLRNGLASSGMLRSFEQEAHLLARLRHPQIAQVYTAGTVRHGSSAVPYFVMELVEDALPLDRSVHSRGLSVRERMLLLYRVAGAVAHGHRQGIVHRDLKPGNILVGADGEPKVIDFGVARSTDADIVRTTMQTDSGQLVGTLRYMSPEQFDADVTRIDQRTDVYALGLVLHELLVGVLPYDLRGRSLVAAARIIRDQPPRALETVPRALASEPGLTGSEARQLAAITEKCLQKLPADRYPSAEHLQADLGRWLAGIPVQARPATVTEKAMRFVRGHRLAVAAALVVCTAAGAAAFFSLQARRQQQLAAVHRAAELAESYYATVQRSAAAADRRNIPIAASLLDRARAAAEAIPGWPIELDCLASRLDDSIAMLRGHDAVMRAVAATAAGDLIATGDDDGVIRLWRHAGDGGVREASRIAGHAAPIWAAAFSPDGRLLLTAAGDGTARLWNTADGTTAGALDRHPAAVYGAAFAADGGALATAAADGSVRIWEAAGGTPRSTFAIDWPATNRDRNVYGLAFSASGSRLAAACGDGVIRLWNPDSGQPVGELRGHTRRVFAVAFSPDGRRLASAAEDGTARLWDVESAACTGTLRHPLRVNAVAWTADGSGVLTVSADAVVRLWNADTGNIIREMQGHRDAVWSVARLADELFVTASADATGRVWNATAGDAPVVRCGTTNGAGVRGVACSPDGRTAATVTAQGRITLWDLATCTVSRELATDRGRVNAVEFSPQGHVVATACGAGWVRVYAVDGGGERGRVQAHAGAAFAVRFSPDGRRLASAGAEPGSDEAERLGPERGAVRIHRIDADGQFDPDGPPATMLAHPARVHGVAWSSGGRRLVTACADGMVREWDPGSGTLLREAAGHTDDVNWVAASGDGRWIMTGSSDGTVRRWSPADGWNSVALTGPVGQVWEVAISPDGTRIAGVGADGSLHLWHAGSGRHLLAIDGHEGPIWGVAFAPNGRSIVTGSDDGTARVWGVTAADLRARRSTARTSTARTLTGGRPEPASQREPASITAGPAHGRRSP